MRAPQWLRRNVVTIFLCVVVLTLMVGTVVETLAASDGLDDREILTLLLFVLFVLLAVLARVRSDNGRQDEVANQPTGVIVPIRARQRFIPSPAQPTVYGTAAVPVPAPPPRQRQPYLRAVEDLPAGTVPSPEEVLGFARGLMASTTEDTSGYPPVEPRREEAT
jgi:hypothetical protein